MYTRKDKHRILKGPNICNVFGKQWVQGYHIKRSLFVRQPDQTKCIWIQRKESLQSRGHLIQELVSLFYLWPIIFFFKPVAKTCFCHFVCPSLCPCVQLNKDYTKNLNIWIALITEQEVKRKQTFGSISKTSAKATAPRRPPYIITNWSTLDSLWSLYWFAMAVKIATPGKSNYPNDEKQLPSKFFLKSRKKAFSYLRLGKMYKREWWEPQNSNSNHACHEWLRLQETWK